MKKRMIVNNSDKSYKISAVLPCRINSTRLLAKPLQPIGEFSILELLIEQLKKSKMISDIVLAISNNFGNQLFIELAKKCNVKYVLGNEEDVLGRIIKGGKKVNSDIILRITSENPYIFWEGIDSLIKSHIKERYDFSYVKGLPLGAGLELINMKSLKLTHKKGSKKHKGELSTLYFYENFKQFKINQIYPKEFLKRPEIRLTVDTPQDLWVARIIHENLGRGKQPIALEKIIKFLDEHPEIKKINSDISIKYKRYT